MTANTRTWPVWDWPVRMIHWSFLPLILFMWWSGEEGEMELHSLTGYAVFVLVVTRIIWGLVGSYHARFTTFLKGPATVIEYFRGKREHGGPGHNPAGGWSTVGLLVVLLIQATSGMFSTDELAFDGPFSGLAYDYAALAGEIHEASWIALQALVVLHLTAIAWYQFRRKQPLIQVMLLGSTPGRHSEHRPRSILLALVVLGLVVTALYLGITFAPEPPSYY